MPSPFLGWWQVRVVEAVRIVTVAQALNLVPRQQAHLWMWNGHHSRDRVTVAFWPKTWQPATEPPLPLRWTATRFHFNEGL
jgi:hypothetical protein